MQNNDENFRCECAARWSQFWLLLLLASQNRLECWGNFLSHLFDFQWKAMKVKLSLSGKLHLESFSEQFPFVPLRDLFTFSNGANCHCRHWNDLPIYVFQHLHYVLCCLWDDKTKRCWQIICVYRFHDDSTWNCLMVRRSAKNEKLFYWQF